MTDESVAEHKKILNKQGVEYDDESSYREVAEQMVDFYTLLAEGEIEEQQRKGKLKEQPKGFSFPGEGRTCPLCGSHVDEDMWYDKWGVKCMDCQDALDKKIVPGYVFKDHKDKKHITNQTMTWKLDVHAATIRKLVRQGKLKARVIPGNGTMVFLRKENSDIEAVINAELAARKAKSN
jgi:hypothetical protein